MVLGEKIKVFGLEKFGSLKAFAEAVGKTPPDLSQYIGPDAKRDPGAGFLKKLYDLGCDMNWLFNDDENKNDNPLLDEIERLRKEVKLQKEALKKIKNIFNDEQ